jgi:YidC/Oxa1 family membrane protein insertase
MDRQAWIAVTLCIIGLIAWQIYTVKHPAPVAPKMMASPTPLAVVPATAIPAGSAAPLETKAGLTPNEAPLSPTPTPAVFAEKTASLRNADLELLLTNRGGGIATAILPKHKAENGGAVKLNAHHGLPIGAIVEKPATATLEEFSILPGEGSVQF